MTPFKVILPFGFILDLRSGLNDRDFDRLLWFIFSFWLVKNSADLIKIGSTMTDFE